MNDDRQRNTATAVCPPTAAALDDHAFLRYSRQLLLEDIGIEGQQRLQAATVLLAGLGGLGSPAALYLAAAGVGTLLLADDDALHITNMQRQILYRSDEIGQSKAQAAQRALAAIKLLCGVPGDSAGQLRLFDGKTLQWRTLRLNRDPHCPVCAAASASPARAVGSARRLTR